MTALIPDPLQDGELVSRVVVALEDLVVDRPLGLAAEEPQALEGDGRLQVDAHVREQASDVGRRLPVVLRRVAEDVLVRQRRPELGGIDGPVDGDDHRGMSTVAYGTVALMSCV